MANENPKSSQHSLRLPHVLKKWLLTQKLNPSESLSAVILRILWGHVEPKSESAPPKPKKSR
jgi:hypothetical protein